MTIQTELHRFKRQQEELYIKFEKLKKRKLDEKPIIVNDMRLYLSSALYHFISAHLRTRSPMIPLFVRLLCQNLSFS